MTQNISFLLLENEPLSNLAANQHTWQSSVETALGDSENAVDGNLNTKFFDGSCMHTFFAPAIWSVDLGGKADIYYVDVLNRAEGGGKICLNFVYKAHYCYEIVDHADVVGALAVGAAPTTSSFSIQHLA